MQRRITVAVLAVAVAAVVLAGLGTTLLSWRQAQRDTAVQLGNEAQALQPFVEREIARSTPISGIIGPIRAKRLQEARRALRLADASVLVIDTYGRVVSGVVPRGVSADAAAMTTPGHPSKGVRGRFAWATASGPPTARDRRVVVVLTRSVPLASGSLRWVALSGAVSVLLAVLAAALVARRITGPLRSIEVATRRIAAGDLATRVGEPPPGAGEEAVELAHSIDAMAASLERSRGTEREFLLAISHDLRTPLTSMRGYAEAIVDGAVDDPRNAADVILRESRRLERLVADLLDLARLEAHQFSLRFEPADLAGVVRSSIAGFVPVATALGIRLEVEGVEAQIPATIDVDRFGQVLANLIENATKYAASRVRISVSNGVGGLMIVVEDDGPGIAASDLPHVFDRRYVARVAPGSDGAGRSGSGLGLAIVRELVGAMGGTVTAGPGRGGVGTALVVALAASPPSGAPIGISPSAAHPVPPPASPPVA